MKKRLLSCALALALAFSLAALPAGAVTFSDIATHWARADIERMANQGLFNGYEDGTFRPENLMRTSEALAMCARVAVPDAQRVLLGQARAAELDELMGSELAWFRDDFAACLEVGILTHDELERILLTGQDQVPMQKAEFARYLVRAMGLGDLAVGLTNVSLTYSDADTVPAALQPYIYLLTLHGVLNGTEKNEIQPLSFLNRAVAATMIGRVLEAMTNLSISIELPRFTTYNWVAGYITDVSAAADGSTLITVNGMMGAHTVTLPAIGVVYQNNMPAKRTELKAGAYAKLALNAAGQADTVRLIAADRLDNDAGGLAGLTAERIVLDYRPYTVNRFTLFSAGGKVGDWSVVESDAGYTEAECILDGRGRALFVTLKGGTREVFGLLSAVEINSVTGTTSLSVSGYDGRVSRYTIPSSASVTSAGLPVVLRAGENVGAHVTLRVSNEDPTVVAAVELDLLNKYIQGSLDAVNTSARTVQITELPRQRVGTYPVDAECAVTVGGVPAAFAAIKSGSYITARVQGGQLVEMSLWPGVVETTGKLVSITYADTTILHVANASGVIEQFSIALAELSNVRITRGGTTVGISALSTGDTVTVTVRFHVLTDIAAIPQSADVSGQVTEISFNTSGATITLTLSGGTTAVYTAASGITVLQNGSVVSLSSIKPGDTLTAVTEGTRIVSAEIKGTAVSSTKLEGTVYLRESAGRKLTLLVSDGAGGTKLVVVNIPYSISSITDTQTGLISVSTLAVGDRLEVWGSYDKQEFTATAVVRVH